MRRCLWLVTNQAQANVLMLVMSASLELALRTGQVVINLHSLQQISASPGGVLHLRTILNIMNRCVLAK